MGFLEAGEPIPWKESLDLIAYVREHGVTQFLNVYNKVKTVTNEDLLWGDELEYGVLCLDSNAGTVKISLRGAEILQDLISKETKLSHPDARYERCHWVPEYGSWMVEGTPEVPYAGFAADLLRVEQNMKVRRARLLNALKPNEICPTVPCFPLLGVGTFTEPPHPPGGPAAQSLFVPDALINPHPRFPALTANIRERRGAKVDIRLPRFQDTNTLQGIVGAPPPATLEEALKMHEVYMDAMAFGMGCCCLQVTFQACDVGESRHLYDQLGVLAPVLLALTAATPIARGALLDQDVRWNIIAGSVDDRTPEEQAGTGLKGTGLNVRSMSSGNGLSVTGLLDASQLEGDQSIYSESMAGGGRRALPKSRYDSISMYICNHKGGEDPRSATSQYNDIDAPFDEAAYQRLVDEGVDGVLARHIAHLFVRDPLVLFHGKVSELDDAASTDHFESLQSTNWQTVRWKPPPPSSLHLGGTTPIGWRVEFRSMEVQLTDFENAAFTAFIVLASRVMLFFDLNLYIPISKVDENMRRAHVRDAVTSQKFFFRQACAAADKPTPEDCSKVDMAAAASAADGEGGRSVDSPGVRSRATEQERQRCCSNGAGHTAEMSCSEILCGKGEYRGLVPMIMAYLNLIGTDAHTLERIDKYMDFICARASGELLTPAQWMRRFVRTHPDYKADSVVSERIAADLMQACHRIGKGELHVPELHGAFDVGTVSAKDAYATPMRSKDASRSNADDSHVRANLDRYTERAELQRKRRKLQADIEGLNSAKASKESELASLNSAIADTLGGRSLDP